MIHSSRTAERDGRAWGSVTCGTGQGSRVCTLGSVLFFFFVAYSVLGCDCCLVLRYHLSLFLLHLDPVPVIFHVLSFHNNRTLPENCYAVTWAGIAQSAGLQAGVRNQARGGNYVSLAPNRGKPALRSTPRPVQGKPHLFLQFKVVGV